VPPKPEVMRKRVIGLAGASSSGEPPEASAPGNGGPGGRPLKQGDESFGEMPAAWQNMR